MNKFKNWLITKLLQADDLVAVPKNWQKEYVKLAGDKVKNSSAILTVIKEYNDLLLDYYNECPMRKIVDMTKDAGLEYKTTMTKEDLVGQLHKEFSMYYENK